MPFDSPTIHPETVLDVQSHPRFCVCCYEVCASVNSDKVCVECSGEDDGDESYAPSSEYLLRWERTV